MTQGTCTYKIDPAPVFLFAYVVGAIACSGFVAVLAAFDPAFQQAKLPVVLETVGYVLVFFGPPYAALCALVLTHYFRYEVTADGVSGQSLLGHNVSVAWSDVEAMKPVQIGNLDFMRVISTGRKRAIWLPMFVRAGSPFDEVAQLWTPQAQFMRKRDVSPATTQRVS